MNLLLIGIIIFVIVYLFLNWFARTSSKRIAVTIKKIIVYLSLLIATIFTVGGKFLFSLPFLFVILSGLKIKGLSLLQYMYLFRLIQSLRSSGRFGRFGTKSSQTSSSLSIEEAYKILGLEKGCSKQEVLDAATKLQKKRCKFHHFGAERKSARTTTITKMTAEVAIMTTITPSSSFPLWLLAWCSSPTHFLWSGSVAPLTHVSLS